LWVADTDYGVGTSNISTFSSVASTSFRNLSTNFAITYGSGRASGVLGQDTVQMAGFEVARQAFGVCDSVSAGLLDSPVSGLMGLAWQTIAASGAMPFWQALVSNKAWDEPLMAFQLTRYVHLLAAYMAND
jgi:cathepsin D